MVDKVMAKEESGLVRRGVSLGREENFCVLAEGSHILLLRQCSRRHNDNLPVLSIEMLKMYSYQSLP